MPNNLKELRLKTKTPAKEMVAVVQTIYSKYDMTSQSKCENSDAYPSGQKPSAAFQLKAQPSPDLGAQSARLICASRWTLLRTQRFGTSSWWPHRRSASPSF